MPYNSAVKMEHYPGSFVETMSSVETAAHPTRSPSFEPLV